jgi:hypothetical protein
MMWGYAGCSISLEILVGVPESAESSLSDLGGEEFVVQVDVGHESPNYS